MLYDFFSTGTYDKNHEMEESSKAFTNERKFMLTGSPSMDILISSNLERLIYFIAGADTEKNAALMADLSSKGAYTIDDSMKAALEGFESGYADEKKTADKIKSLYDETGYVIDTHTAVAGAVYDEYKAASGDDTVTVIASTASPYKFAKTVMTAIDPANANEDDFKLIDKLCEISNTDIPQAIEDIRSAAVLHDIVCDKEDMPAQVKEFLGV